MAATAWTASGRARAELDIAPGPGGLVLDAAVLAGGELELLVAGVYSRMSAL